MSPDTVHLLAQVIRHQRALLTSVEKWVASPTFSATEADAASRYLRRVLNAFERSLGSGSDIEKL
jgi:hypothetical protein